MASDSTENASGRRICLARVATAHGVKGLVKLWVYADNPQLLETAPALYTSAQGGRQITIDLRNPHGDYWIAAIEGVEDRDTATRWRHTEIWMDRDHLPDVETDDEFYYADLIGLKAYDDNGTELGEVVNIENFGAGDLLEILPSSSESYYVPFTNEFVPSLDIDKGWLTVIPPV
jgi:16S rRNA processing protein RimM